MLSEDSTKFLRNLAKNFVDRRRNKKMTFDNNKSNITEKIEESIEDENMENGNDSDLVLRTQSSIVNNKCKNKNKLIENENTVVRRERKKGKTENLSKNGKGLLKLKSENLENKYNFNLDNSNIHHHHHHHHKDNNNNNNSNIYNNDKGMKILEEIKKSPLKSKKITPPVTFKVPDNLFDSPIKLNKGCSDTNCKRNFVKHYHSKSKNESKKHQDVFLDSNFNSYNNNNNKEKNENVSPTKEQIIKNLEASYKVIENNNNKNNNNKLYKQNKIKNLKTSFLEKVNNDNDNKENEKNNCENKKKCSLKSLKSNIDFHPQFLEECSTIIESPEIYGGNYVNNGCCGVQSLCMNKKNCNDKEKCFRNFSLSNLNVINFSKSHQVLNNNNNNIDDFNEYKNIYENEFNDTEKSLEEVY